MFHHSVIGKKDSIGPGNGLVYNIYAYASLGLNELIFDGFIDDALLSV